MGLYLNSNRSLKNYEELYRSDYFIDKSLIIERLNKYNVINISFNKMPDSGKHMMTI